MTVIPDERMLNRLLVEIKCEFSEIDQKRVAEVLPTEALAHALTKRTSWLGGFSSAKEAGQKLEVMTRILAVWFKHPKASLGELISAATMQPGACDVDLDFIEDGDLVKALESYNPDPRQWFFRP
jgi:hypothetical protein